MPKLGRIKLKKVKEIFRKLPRALGENVFPTLLVLFFISLILGTFIFYKYSFLAGKEKPGITGEPVEFKEKTYQTVVDEWQARNKIFSEVNLKEYSNPFR